ncbi:hypothetical protein PTKIN_Ptkin01aG0377100 [Pterospermum kingtungense]
MLQFIRLSVHSPFVKGKNRKAISLEIKHAAIEGAGTLSEVYQSARKLFLRARDGIERLERLESSISGGAGVGIDTPELSFAVENDITQIHSLCADMDRLWLAFHRPQTATRSLEKSCARNLSSGIGEAYMGANAWFVRTAYTCSPSGGWCIFAALKFLSSLSDRLPNGASLSQVLLINTLMRISSLNRSTLRGKTVLSSRIIANRKVEQVAEEADSLKDSLDKYSMRNQRRMLEAKERAELLGRANGESAHVLRIFDEEAQAMQSVRNSSRMLQESFATGTAILSKYAEQ